MTTTTTTATAMTAIQKLRPSEPTNEKIPMAMTASATMSTAMMSSARF